MFFERVDALKTRLRDAGLPVIPTASHIVPVAIGDAARATAISRRLLDEFAIYATPINYPTVPPRGHRAAAADAGDRSTRMR